MLADTHVHPYFGECPRHIIESLQRYARHGIPVGGFLQAVLENNLKEAVARADPWISRSLAAVVSYVYNEMPRASHGSPANYEDWVSQGGLSGRAEAMMRARYEYYILDDNDNPVPVESSRQWAEWIEANTKRRRIVREEVAAGVDVSTVFLGTDYQFGDGPPILFETMVFGGPLGEEQERYSTRAEAIEGHKRMVERVREAMAKGGE